MNNNISQIQERPCRGKRSLTFLVIVTCVCCPLQANKSDLTRKERELWNISLQSLIHFGIIIVVDVLFHFMYILTIPTDMKLLKHLSDWALGLCLLTQIPSSVFCPLK